MDLINISFIIIIIILFCKINSFLNFFLLHKNLLKFYFCIIYLILNLNLIYIFPSSI